MTAPSFTETWKFDRSADLPTGPWHDEPDKAHWIDETTGLDCLIVRNRIGGLCGYVGVPEGHPWYGADYNTPRSVDGEWPDVHGGLTYAAPCPAVHHDDAVCHRPAPGRPEVWWLGFDCCHLGDLVPCDRDSPYRSGAYRDMGYVLAEVRRLAAQAGAVR